MYIYTNRARASWHVVCSSAEGQRRTTMASVIACVLGGSPTRIENVETTGDVKERLALTNYTASVNGEPESDEFELDNEDFVSLAPAVKGGVE